MIETTKGTGPIILGLPHTGTEVPPDIWDRLNLRGRQLADTDWHIHKLYSGLRDDLTSVRTPVHRYVIDVNRDPGGQSLYPGQNTTELCPTIDFDGVSIYRDGMAPDAGEVAVRTETYHAPYHAALSTEIERIRALHGFAILYDCHSIRGQISFLFDGQLPDFNIGTNSSTTCDPRVEKTVDEICARARGHTSVLNGRFKGGWTTRHYGQPSAGVHAIQIELAQSTYMQEAPPWTYDVAKAEDLRLYLSSILNALHQMAETGDLL